MMWRFLVPAAIIFAIAAVAQVKGPTSAAAAPNTGADSAAYGATRVTVPAAVLNPLIGEPQRHFNQAASLFSAGDYFGAASEIRASASLLRLEAGREGGAKAGGLLSSAGELDGLATRVERGDVSSRSELDGAFARADLALAAHYRAMADEALVRKQHVATGLYIRAATDSLDDASHWTGQNPHATTSQAQAMDQLHALETKVRRGVNWSYDEARRGVGYLGLRIQRLGAQMQKVGNAANSNTTGT